MSVTLWLALCCQAIAVALIRIQLGKRWLRRPVTVLVLTAVTYNGLVEILLAIPSVRVWDNNRLGVAQNYIDSAALITSVGLLAMVVCYLVTRPDRGDSDPIEPRAATAAEILDWRVFALCCLPLAAFTYDGRGYDSVSASAPGTSGNLASEFLTVLAVLAVFSFLLRHGMRWFVLALLVQSVFLATVGERNPLITNAIILLVLLAHVGLRPSPRQICATLALTAVVILAITGYRGEGEASRSLFSGQAGLATRIGAIGEGLDTVAHPASQQGTNPGLAAQAAERLDGNAFAGEVMQGLHSGDRLLGFTDVAKSLLVVVPSALWPSKLDDSAGLNPTGTEITEFGMRPVTGIGTSPLPTFLGQYLGFIGPYWLVAFLALLGFGFGKAERWLMRQFTVARLVALAAAIQAAFAYEAGLPTMLVGLRTALVLAGGVFLVQKTRQVAGPDLDLVPAEPALAAAGHELAPAAPGQVPGLAASPAPDPVPARHARAKPPGSEVDAVRLQRSSYWHRLARALHLARPEKAHPSPAAPIPVHPDQPRGRHAKVPDAPEAPKQADAKPADEAVSEGAKR